MGRRNRGQAILELAIIAPLLLGIVVVVVQLALLYTDYLSVVSVTRDTTRWIATNPSKTDAEVRDHIQQILPGNLLFSEFTFDDPPTWLNPSCADLAACTTYRRAGYAQTVKLAYTPDHHLFLRGPLTLVFFNANTPLTLPAYPYSMIVSDTALAPEGTQPPTSTVPATSTPPPTSTSTAAPGQPTQTPTSAPTGTPTLTPTAVPPLAGSAVPIAGTEGSTFDGSVARFSASGSSPFSATINWSDPQAATSGTVIQDAPGQFHVEGSHTFEQAGTWVVGIVISDGTNTVTVTSNATVGDAQLVATGSTFNATATYEFSGSVASFIDNNAFAQAASFTDTTIDWGDNAGVSGATVMLMSSSPGPTFSVSGVHTYAAGGTYAVTVTIADQGGSADVAHTTAIVANGPVVVTPVEAIRASEGADFQGAVATFTAIDTGPFSATINWGDGATSPVNGQAVTISPDGRGDYIVSGQHAYAEAGRYDPVTVSVTHAADYTAVVASHAEVGGAAVHSTGASINATANIAFAGTAGTFTDDNATVPARLDDFVVTIDWGDQSASNGSVTGGSPNIVSGAHTYTSAGSYAVQVTIVDAGDTSSLAAGTATVAPPPFAVTSAAPIDDMVESIGLTRSVATFAVSQAGSDAGAAVSDFTATIQWGDGTASSGAVSATGPGSFAVDGTHAYAEETCAYDPNGTWLCSAPEVVTVTVSDAHRYSDSASTTAQVGDAPLQADTSSFTVAAGQPFTLPVFSDQNPNALLDDYRTARWSSTTPAQTWSGAFANSAGNHGTTGTGTLLPDSGQSGGFLLQSGTFEYVVPGTYSLDLDVQDSGGQTLSRTFSIVVSDNSPLTYVGQGTSGITIDAVEGQPWSGPLAEFTSTDSSLTAADITATIAWANGSATSPGAVSGDSTSGFIVSGSYTFDHAGQVPVSVSLVRTGGGWTTGANLIATVDDAALHSSGTTIYAVTGTPFSDVVATFTDDNPLAAWQNMSFPISWGDRSADTAGSVTSDGRGGWSILGAHVYEAQGTYPVNVSVADSGGASTTANGQAIVSAPPTATPTPPATDTPTPESTSTPVPTDTPAPTDTPSPATPTPQMTATPDATNTPVPTTVAVDTPTPPPTGTPIPGATDTPTPADTPTSTPVPPTPTATPRPTRTPIPIGTLEGH